MRNNLKKKINQTKKDIKEIRKTLVMLNKLEENYRKKGK